DLVLRLRGPDEGSLVPVLRQVPIDTVVGGVQPPTDKPLPEGCVAGVEGGVPVLLPGEEIRVLLEAFREVLLLEPVENSRVAGIGLANEFRGRDEVLLFSPVDRDLGFGYFDFLRRVHYLIGFDRHRLIQPPSGESQRTTGAAARPAPSRLLGRRATPVDLPCWRPRRQPRC